MKTFFLFSAWLPVTGWAGLIFYLSSLPDLRTDLETWDFFLRKGAHVVEYAILALFLFRALRKTWPTQSLRSLLSWGLFLSILYAFSDEFHQSFVPGRFGSLKDVLIDSCGVVLSSLLYKNTRFQEMDDRAASSA